VTFRYAPGGHTAVVVWPVCVLLHMPMTNAVVQRLYAALSKNPTPEVALDLLASGGITNMPSFGILAPDGYGVRLIVRGDVVAQLAGTSERVASKGSLNDTTIEGGSDITLIVGEESSQGATWTVRDGVVAAGRVDFGSPKPIRQASDGSPSTKGRRGKPSDTAPVPAPPPTLEDAPANPSKSAILGTTEAAPPTMTLDEAISDDDDDTSSDKPFIESFDWSGQPHGTAAPAPAPKPRPKPKPEPEPAEPTADPPPADDRVRDRTIQRPKHATSGEMVPAVRCLLGHLNPPFADYCRVCPAPIPAQETIEVLRPPLGSLHLANGLVLKLDRGAILGRSPQAVRGTPGPPPNLVRLNDPEKDISGQHLEVRLEGWFVTVIDLKSTNGTQVILPGREPFTLRPGEPMTIEPGTKVVLADVFDFVFEADQ